MRTIEEIKEFINDGCYHNNSWDDLVNGLSDEELELMRQYSIVYDILLIEDTIREDTIYKFMRLMACEYLIGDDISRAKNICDYISPDN